MRLARTALMRVRALNDESGYVLTELLVVSVLLSIVLGAALVVSETTSKLAPMHLDRGHVVRKGQAGLERMTRELRQASGIIASPNSIEFDTYVRPGGGDSEKRRVRYDCSQQSACRRFEGPVAGVLSETGELVDGVQNATATPCGPAGVVFTNEPPRYVAVTLALRVRGYSKPVCLRDGTEMRNAPGS